MNGELHVRPADPSLLDAPEGSAPRERLLADLARFRDQIDERFPEGAAVGSTGALSERPVLRDGTVVVRPEVAVRPMVLHAVMTLAAPLQLVVECPALGVVADPRHRIDIDVHRVAVVDHAAPHDHARRGRPHGTLPWITRPLLGALVDALERDGDHLVLESDPTRRFRIERTGLRLVLSVTDGPGAPATSAELDDEIGDADSAVVTGVAWRWMLGDHTWRDGLAWVASTEVAA